MWSGGGASGRLVRQASGDDGRAQPHRVRLGHRLPGPLEGHVSSFPSLAIGSDETSGGVLRLVSLYHVRVLMRQFGEGSKEYYGDLGRVQVSLDSPFRFDLMKEPT